MNYLKILEESFEYSKELNPDYWKDATKIEFLSSEIFNIVTYENNVSSFLGYKILEICKNISNNTTFEYIKDEENNFYYLTLINLPFLMEKIEWGGSVRGAWWDWGIKLDADLCYKGEDIRLTFETGEEWKEFVDAMLEFVRNDGSHSS